MSSSTSPGDALTALVVDDEELACRGLRRKLEESGGVSVVRTTTDAVEAVAILRDDPPDIAFLDIQMPDLSGFDVLAHFPESRRAFAAVFCTAHEHGATRAFEEAALDYLVKPVDRARLAATLARIRRWRELGTARGAEEELGRARAVGLTGWLARFVVRSRGVIRLLEASQVVAIASEAHRAVAYAADGEHILDPSLAVLETQLDPTAFVRAHRAWIVNVAHVVHVDQDTVRVTGGRDVPLSRRNRAAFLAALAAKAARVTE